MLWKVLPKVSGKFGVLQTLPSPEGAPEDALPLGLTGGSPSGPLPDALPIPCAPSYPWEHFPEHRDFPQHPRKHFPEHFQKISRSAPLWLAGLIASQDSRKTRETAAGTFSALIFRSLVFR